MAHHDDDVPVADLLARLGEGGARELFRRLLESALQDLIDAELAGAIGAGRHEHTESRSNWRNGSRPRTLSSWPSTCLLSNRTTEREFAVFDVHFLD